MGLFDIFFKKKEITPKEINYQEYIDKSWDIFRQGLKNPNPKIRRITEDSVYFVDTPEGKRFFAAGMQEPDLNNRLNCLQKLYERGGWRLSEQILKVAYSDEELSIEEKEEIIYKLGTFSDPGLLENLIQGLENTEKRLRVATLAAMAGIKNSESLPYVIKHIETVSDIEEKFSCGLVFFQYNKPEGKEIIDQIFEKEGIKPELVTKLKYLDFSKTLFYLNLFKTNENPEIKKIIVDLVPDSRGKDLLYDLLRDSSLEVVNNSIGQIIKLGLTSFVPVLKELKNNGKLEKVVKIALAHFLDKEEINELEAKIKNLNFEQIDIENLKTLATAKEHNISEIIEKLILPLPDLTNLSDEKLNKLNIIMEILVKYGKIASIPVVSRYFDLKYLGQEDYLRWKIICNSAAAVLCIVERNSSFYLIRQKMKEQGI